MSLKGREARGRPEPSGPEASGRQKSAFTYASLVLLLERAGGRLEFTEAEYQAVVARHGGSSKVNIRFQVIREEGRPDRVQALLQEKPPKNLELPS